MIKNLFAAIGMTFIYTGQPINRADTTQLDFYRSINPISKTNIYTEQVYTNDQLDSFTEYATIEYEQINIENYNLKARTKIITNRSLPNEEYEIFTQTLIAINTTLDVYENTLDILISPPEYNAVGLRTGISRYIYGKYSTLTTQQDYFINGGNYTNDELKNLNLKTNETDILSTSFTELPYETSTTLTGYNYYYYETYLEYDPTKITSNGANLVNNRETLKKITIYVNYNVTINPSNYEVIDIPGLMFQILGMPFAWLSAAYNFTLFPGTPYAINISHLLLGLLASLIAIIIFRLIMKGL